MLRVLLTLLVVLAVLLFSSVPTRQWSLNVRSLFSVEYFIPLNMYFHPAIHGSYMCNTYNF